MILMPLLDTLSDPDFINGLILSLCKQHQGLMGSTVPTTETFISILQSSSSVSELNAVLQSVDKEITFVRSKDNDDDQEMSMKSQLDSLVYLKKVINTYLSSNKAMDEIDDSEEQTNRSDLMKQTEHLKTIPVSFETILQHNVALEYFIDFMASIQASNYINFYINVESFKISVEQGFFEMYLGNLEDSFTSNQHEQLKMLIREAAINIYETYLARNGPNRLELVDECYGQQIHDSLNSLDSSCWMKESLFDEAFNHVKEIILQNENFFPSFKNSRQFLKLVKEVDLINMDTKDLVAKSDDQDVVQSISSSAHNIGPSALLNDGLISEGRVYGSYKLSSFNANIVETGVLTEYGKSFVAYLINVDKANGEKWVVLRRYSEFYTFHQILVEKCSHFHFEIKNVLILPPKTVIRNRLNQTLVQNRKYMLNLYLKKLNYLFDKFVYLQNDIEKFLQPGSYFDNLYSCDQEVQGSGTDDTKESKLPGDSTPRNILLNPIKTLGNVVKNGSENILDGFQKLSRTFSSQPEIGGINSQTKQNSINETSTINALSTDRRVTYNNQFSTTSEESSMSIGDDDVLSLDAGSSVSEINIPLLRLLEEIFDLKSQNFWFRKRMLELFKQIIEATYSDTINRKVVDFIESATSASSMKSYLELFK